MDHDWAPCRFIDYAEYLDEDEIVFRYGLAFDAFDPTRETLESRGFMGGGYTWYGIVDSMVRSESPDLNSQLDYSAEGSMLVVQSSNIEALRKVLTYIRRATTDQATLLNAIKNADASLIE